MPRWCQLESAECTDVAAVKDGKLMDCMDPDSPDIVYVLRAQMQPYIPIALKKSQFSKFAMPLIKSVYPMLPANSLVSVQPLLSSGIPQFNRRYVRRKPQFDGNMVFDGKIANRLDGLDVRWKLHLTKKSKQIMLEAIKKFTSEFE